MCNGQAPYELSRSGGHTQHPVMESRGGGEDVRAPGHSTRSLDIAFIHTTMEDTTMVDVFFSSAVLFGFFHWISASTAELLSGIHPGAVLIIEPQQ